MSDLRETIALAREQGYREGYGQAKADMLRELGAMTRQYLDAQLREEATILNHLRAVVKTLGNARTRR